MKKYWILGGSSLVIIGFFLYFALGCFGGVCTITSLLQMLGVPVMAIGGILILMGLVMKETKANKKK